MSLPLPSDNLADGMGEVNRTSTLRYTKVTNVSTAVVFKYRHC